MASQGQHISKAEHNERFYKYALASAMPFTDWAVTGIFYAALHYLRALAARRGFKNVSSYGEMDKLFTRLTELRRNQHLYDDYRQLKDDSREARYEMRPFTLADIQDLERSEFTRIRAFARAELGLP